MGDRLTPTRRPQGAGAVVSHAERKAMLPESETEAAQISLEIMGHLQHAEQSLNRAERTLNHRPHPRTAAAVEHVQDARARHRRAAQALASRTHGTGSEEWVQEHLERMKRQRRKMVDLLARAGRKEEVMAG